MSGGRLYIQVAQQGQGTSTSSGIMYLTGYNNTTASEIHLKANNTYNTGHFHLDANDYLKIGNNDDIQIYHNGTSAIAQNSTGNFYFGNYSNTNLIFQTNNTNRWAIWNTGHFIPDANNNVDIGSSSTRVRNIYANGVTISNGSITSSSYGTQGDFSGQFGRIRVGADTYGNTIRCVTDTNFNLASNNTIAFYIGGATDGTSFGTGIAFFDSGGLNPATGNTFDLGTTSRRWRNLYSQDLQLSNKGSKNDVDGTWGDWTLQEGEHKVFMINNRTGKKYSLKMEEE